MAQPKYEYKYAEGIIIEKTEQEFEKFKRYIFKLKTENATREFSLGVFGNMDDEKKEILEAMAKDFDVDDKVRITYYERMAGGQEYLNIVTIEELEQSSDIAKKVQENNEADKKYNVEPIKTEEKPLQNTNYSEIKKMCLKNACILLQQSTIEMEFDFMCNRIPERVIKLAKLLDEEIKKQKYFEG